MALIVDAAEFDGSTSLTRAAFMADSPVMTETFWFNVSDAAAIEVIFSHGYFFSYLLSDGTVQFQIFDSLGVNQRIVISSVSGLDDGQWHSVLFSADVGHDVGSRVSTLAIDGVYDSGATITVDIGVAFDIGLNTQGAIVGADIGPVRSLTGCLAEITADLQYIDFSNSTNIAKFVTGDNKPEDIGTDGSTAYGAACAMYLHLDDAEAADNFKLNAGTGGNFTVTGTLTTCASSPSDGGFVPGTTAGVFDSSLNILSWF